MLIRDEHDHAEVTRHKLCVWCRNDLSYPRIVSPDGAHSYHVACALHLVREITLDVEALLNDEHAADLVKHIEAAHVAQRPISRQPHA